MLNGPHGAKGHPLLFFCDTSGFAGPHGGDENDIGVLLYHLFPAVHPGVFMGRDVYAAGKSDELIDKGFFIGRVKGFDTDLDEHFFRGQVHDKVLNLCHLGPGRCNDLFRSISCMDELPQT